MGRASQPKVLAMATDCSATCQQGPVQPREALHRQCIGVHRLYDIRSLYTQPTSQTPSSYPALYTLIPLEGSHCLFVGRYPLPNYRPCFSALSSPPPIFEGHRPPPAKIKHSQYKIIYKCDLKSSKWLSI